jgi:phosphopantothenoylcysteine decarboxylase/phosphopantothenate--cysteine ligase
LKKNLKGLKILVTAGPTREYFDPVRFLSNPSSGKMGYAIAEEATRKGAKVTLVSGPSPLTPHPSLKFIRVVTADQMYRAVMREAPRADIIIMAAAVSDYRPATYSRRKLKKKGKRLIVSLKPTRDILKELGRRKKRGQILVGFAAETDRLVQNALKKLREKHLDLIVANRVGSENQGFESDANRVLLLSSTGKRKQLPLLPKQKIASPLFDFITLNLSKW